MRKKTDKKNIKLFNSALGLEQLAKPLFEYRTILRTKDVFAKPEVPQIISNLRILDNEINRTLMIPTRELLRSDEIHKSTIVQKFGEISKYSNTLDANRHMIYNINRFYRNFENILVNNDNFFKDFQTIHNLQRLDDAINRTLITPRREILLPNKILKLANTQIAQNVPHIPQLQMPELGLTRELSTLFPFRPFTNSEPSTTNATLTIDHSQTTYSNQTFEGGISAIYSEPILIRVDGGMIIEFDLLLHRDVSMLLWIFEIYLHNFINEAMIKAYKSDWVDTRVSEKVRGGWKRYKKKAIDNNETGLPLVYYAGLQDCCNIIVNDDHWIAAFKNVFHKREQVKELFNRIIIVRNSVAHPRPITWFQYNLIKPKVHSYIKSMRRWLWYHGKIQ